MADPSMSDYSFPGSITAMQREFEGGYSMQLAFGKVVDGRLDERISLALPDESDLSVEENFVARVDY